MAHNPRVPKAMLPWAILSAFVFFGVLAAPLFVDREFARSYIIGPHGIFAVFWIVFLTGILALAASAGSRRR